MVLLNNLTNIPNKRLPGLQKCSKIGFTYPQRSAHVGITKGRTVRGGRVKVKTNNKITEKKKNNKKKKEKYILFVSPKQMSHVGITKGRTVRGGRVKVKKKKKYDQI